MVETQLYMKVFCRQCLETQQRKKRTSGADDEHMGKGNAQETFQHLFMEYPDSNKIWSWFAGAAGVEGPFLQVKGTIIKWWKADCVVKLKPMYTTVPAFIIWQIWKRRNKIRNGGKMSRHAMDMEINRNL
ncbi:hypothetical protein H5410_045744 [Solanum commersonii]|uniref:Uncharacterized protein n=1 Tax=Solanum commersonii TaxID=4109 RepID=A0A9J5XDL8_SOLCO|nr:hypothetical protein H5410_045744 [Solanum commersonii]